MRKIEMIRAILLCSLLFSIHACKKYNCSCFEYRGGIAQREYQNTYHKIHESSTEKAQDKCNVICNEEVQQNGWLLGSATLLE